MEADHRAIEQLHFRYAELMDEGDLVSLSRMFADAKLLEPSGAVIASGSAEAQALWQRTVRIYPNSGRPHTRHVTSNIQIDVQGDIACARSCFVVYQSLLDFPLQAIISGRYRDSFQCREGQWRFASRQFLPDMFGDLSRHLLSQTKLSS